ncbi:MAG TPA: efflux RND transporter permease subunit [Caulobacteraceae bacterium]|nr:efflux RND transporter permease subunit [Caulobacteraceae bacterium]
MLSRFFIERPIFATVIAIVIMVAGALAIRTLPIEQYPTIAPPSVGIFADYPGASAATVETSVTQVIEQQLTGLDHMLYFTSSSGSDGSAQIEVTFEPGTNADIAQVQVQNKLQSALPLLPVEVTEQGVNVAKAQGDFLMVVALYDTSGRYTSIDIADYLRSYLVDPLARINGVGNVRVFGGQYAIRIWLNPYRLQSFGLMPSDVRNAVLSQNVQVTGGEVGGLPSPPDQELDATVTAQSLMTNPDQFKAIILKTQPDGSVVRLGDVARVELGADDYSSTTRLNGRPAGGVAIQLSPGANALTTADLVKAKATQLAASLPQGLHVSFPVDSTTFIKLSINQVIITLVEAILLVIGVMFLFLQDWRVTLIPAVAVPVVLLGTFGVLAAFGYSINTLTMFAMVLAIGLLVDDAIVVVENVERIMSEEGLSPKDATIRSMNEITGALVGVAMVLAAVFLPMAFIGGSTGVIYRQFSITIVSAMALSILVALTLTPALCATLLKPVEKGHRDRRRGFFDWFNRTFAGAVRSYQASLGGVIRRPLPALVLYAVLVAALGVLLVRLPTAFLPVEDQGSMIGLYTLPVGATQSRTVAVGKQIEHYFLTDETRNIEALFTVAGFNFSGNGQNLGQAFIHLSDWKDRPGRRNSASAIAQRATRAFSQQVRDGQVYILVPPAVPGLGSTSGFDLELEDRAGLGHDRLMAAQSQLMALAKRDPVLANVRPNNQPDTPQLHLDIDQGKATALGLNVADIDDTFAAAWGSEFLNNFVDRGRVKRVYMQGDAPFRSRPEDIGDWYVRGSTGSMAPFSAFATSAWTVGPSQLGRYNGQPALEIQGQSAPGQSSGAAMREMEKLIAQLPHGVGYEWTGLSYQELLSGSQAPFLFSLSVLVVFLCLAALYESWSIPLSVILVVPLGVFGAVAAATLRGFYNDVYFQVGLLTTIGLSAKNAILIVQFADVAERQGAAPREAAMEAARLRLRPIIMTSLAFMAGVFPLAIASGAGAASQHDIGTGVIGGMLAATFLAIFFVPLFFIGVRQWAAAQRRRARGSAPQGGAA